MITLRHILSAFDAEAAQLSLTRTAVTRKFLETTAKRQRQGLVEFWKSHQRLPNTIDELLASGIGIARFQQVVETRGARDGSDAVYPDISVQEFLLQTEYYATGIGHMGMEVSWNALRLVHAAYRAYDPKLFWASAAQELSERGFTQQQIDLVRNDPTARSAMSSLLRLSRW